MKKRKTFYLSSETLQMLRLHVLNQQLKGAEKKEVNESLVVEQAIQYYLRKDSVKKE